jgi:hypothetical protein
MGKHRRRSDCESGTREYGSATGLAQGLIPSYKLVSQGLIPSYQLVSPRSNATCEGLRGALVDQQPGRAGGRFRPSAIDLDRAVADHRDGDPFGVLPLPARDVGQAVIGGPTVGFVKKSRAGRPGERGVATALRASRGGGPTALLSS